MLTPLALSLLSLAVLMLVLAFWFCLPHGGVEEASEPHQHKTKAKSRGQHLYPRSSSRRYHRPYGLSPADSYGAKLRAISMAAE